MRVSKKDTSIFIVIFFALLTTAWILHRLVFHASVMQGSYIAIDTLYWIAAKLAIWLVYPIIFFKGKIDSQTQLIGLERKNLKKGVFYGLLISVFWIIVSLVLQHSFKLPAGPYWLIVYVVLFTPFIEEVVFRGYILGSLMTNTSKFYLANILTSVLFVAVHCVGWYFQGRILVNLMSFSVVSIFILSLVLGYARMKSKSLLASIMIHGANNLFSIFIKN